MTRWITYLVAIVAVGAAANWFKWGDAFHLLLGILPLAALAAVLAWRRRRAGPEPEYGEDLRPGLLCLGVRGLLLAGAAVAVLWVAFRLLEQTPLYGVFYDDRAVVQEKLRTLEDAGDYAAAAQAIQERLRRPLSPAWARELAQEQCRDLVEAAKQQSSLEARGRLLEEAQKAARQYGCDDELPRLMLVETTRAGAFQERVRALRAKGEWAEAVQDLQAALKDCTDGERKTVLAQSLCETWLEWGSRRPALCEQETCYKEAVKVSERYGLPPGPAARALEQAGRMQEQAARMREMARAALEERNRPTEVEDGSRVTIRRLDTSSYPPVVSLDVTVEDPARIPVFNLRESDFVVKCGSRTARSVEVARVRLAAPATHLVFLLDRSGSMSGKPIEEAKRGLQTFLQALRQAHVEARLLAFDDKVEPIGEWTDDPAAMATGLGPLVARGGTALRLAFVKGLDELDGRPGSKHIVLFTDGRDTHGGPDLAALVARAKGAGVMIHALGLKTAELDVAVLKDLAEQTGGSYFEAAKPEEIESRLSSVSRTLLRAFYRLVFRPENLQRGQEQVEVSVGLAGNPRVSASRMLSLGTSAH